MFTIDLWTPLSIGSQASPNLSERMVTMAITLTMSGLFLRSLEPLVVQDHVSHVNSLRGTPPSIKIYMCDGSDASRDPNGPREEDIYAFSPSAQTANPESNVTSFLDILLRAKLRFVVFASDNLLMQKRFDNVELLVVLHNPNSHQQIDLMA
ncbi:hypothetical protein N7465_000334 [Penicillium sp. CMV-2018d]|nr:hypothetical protein N7465_000334 [Penicillium sp. CMV-2018d]